MDFFFDLSFFFLFSFFLSFWQMKRSIYTKSASGEILNRIKH